MSRSTPVVDFLHELRPGDIPERVAAQLRVCLRDLIATAAGGSTTALSGIIRDYCAAQFCSSGRGARMLFDGRRVSRAGAALAGGMSIDSLDAHDGHALTKGHAGVAVLPAALAYSDELDPEQPAAELLAAVLVGYEIAMRAGVALHRTAADYHTSGAWTALGVAALGARLLRLTGEQSRHALGIAEYHGPRSQMMRCIDHPTMLKDGSGWGAMAGVSAADLARLGFTGAPALLCESADTADLRADLGQRWYLLEMYFKPYPVCRWAQPAIKAALGLQREHGFAAQDIAVIRVETFYEATRLTSALPGDTEQAQYSLPYPLAAILVHGRLGAREVSLDALADPRVRQLSTAVEMFADPALSARFPGERLARVKISLNDGRTLESGVTGSDGDPDCPLSEAELEQKFRDLVEPAYGAERANAILGELDRLNEPVSGARGLLDLICS